MAIEKWQFGVVFVVCIMLGGFLSEVMHPSQFGGPAPNEISDDANWWSRQNKVCLSDPKFSRTMTMILCDAIPCEPSSPQSLACDETLQSRVSRNCDPIVLTVNCTLRNCQSRINDGSQLCLPHCLLFAGCLSYCLSARHI